MDRRGGTNEGTERARKEPCPATKGCPGADRLSALSDELLLHILSFLQIREAISTCHLSRRWRYLYHNLSSLDFIRDGDDVPAWFIDRVLLLHAAPRIEIFRLSLRLEDEGEVSSVYRQIDSGLLFAVRRDVRVLYILAFHHYAVKACYGLPPWVFHCRTLEDFSVQNCRLCLPTYIRLVSLKKMCLGFIQFHDDELKRLLVGCPLLQSLELAYCNKKCDLVIDARESRKLEELVITDDVDGNHSRLFAGEMQICAPSVKYLTFKGTSRRRQYEVRDLSSLVAASFELDENRILYEDEVDENRILYEDDADAFTTGLLLRIPQVQVLKLCSWSLQAFFITISELGLNLDSALPGVTRLELTTWLEEPELQAILSALHSCSKLRTLVLSIPLRSVNNDSDETYGTGSRRSLFLNSNIVMQDLKTINIQGLPRYNQDPAEEDSETEDFVAQKMENGIGLIGFLLRISPALEKLIVQPEEDINTRAEKWELLSKLSSDLLSLPRASPKAQVIMDGK